MGESMFFDSRYVSDPEADLDVVAKGNGYRIFMDGTKLVVQDLCQGWWIELSTRRVAGAEGVRAIQGGLAALRQHDRLWARIAKRMETVATPKRLLVDDLVQVLMAGNRGEPRFPVPTPRQIRKAADRSIWEKVEEAEVRAVAAVASLVAMCGGSAPRYYLEQVLSKRLGDREQASAVLRTAVRLGRFERAWSGGTSFYKMWPDWQYFERIPAP